MDIFTIMGKIALDGVDEAKKQLGETGESASGFGQKLQGCIATAAKVGTAIATGVAAATAALYGVATSAASATDRIDKLSQKIGISRDAFQELDFICSQSGTSVETLQMGIKTLTNQMQSASSGTKSATEIFKKLGVSIYDTTGELKDQETMMWEAMSALQGLENQTEKAALATDLFGRSGSELMPLLNGASGSIEAMREQAHELGLVLDDEAIDAGVRLTDTIDQVKRSFSAITTKIGASVMHRYVSGYDGIRKMLASVGGKLKFKFKDGRVVLSALPVHDYSRDEEFDADLVSFKAVRNYKSVNHLICLGAGELADRLVVHLYADTEGNISQTQTQTGMDEVSAIYEYNNIDNEEELISEGTAKFKEILSADEISIDFDSDDDKYDVGDIIGAYDPITHLFATASIEKKIVTIKDGRITISLSPDKAKGGISMEIGGASIGGGGGGTSVSVDDVVTETLLWENASPTNEFNQQTISIPLGEYDMYKILYAPSTAYSTREMSMDARVGNGCVLVGMWADSDTIFHRSVASSTTGVTFYAAYANKAQSNSCCIPLAVYGIKIVDVRGVGGGSPGGTNIEVPVSIENGGTGATTAEEARANLGFVDSTGWVDLGLGSAVSESTENMGKSPYPCAYRVENGNHVYIAFNCKFTYAGSGLRVNNTAIPADHRPSKQVYTYVPMGGKYIARVITTPAGWVSIEWVQNLLSTTATTSVTSNWIDGYVDYWI